MFEQTPTAPEISEAVNRLERGKADRLDAEAGKLVVTGGTGNFASTGKGLTDFFEENGAAKNAAMLAGQAPSWYIQPRANLLINGWLGQGVINQQSKTAYTADGSNSWLYTIDGWRIYASSRATVEVLSDGVRITADANNEVYFDQIIENPAQLYGGPATVTFHVREFTGTVSVSASWGTWAETPVTQAGDVSVTSPVLSGDVRVSLRIRKGGSAVITRAKLEAGDRFTGWIETNPQQELAKCQRYFMRLSGNATHIGTGFAYNTTSSIIVVPVPVAMRLNRIKPTLEHCFLNSSNHLGAASIAVTEIGDANCSANSVALVAITAGGLVKGEALTLQIRSPDGFLDFDANL